jgi:hypothetical protein
MEQTARRRDSDLGVLRNTRTSETEESLHAQLVGNGHTLDVAFSLKRHLNYCWRRGGCAQRSRGA